MCNKKNMYMLMQDRRGVLKLKPTNKYSEKDIGMYDTGQSLEKFSNEGQSQWIQVCWTSICEEQWWLKIFYGFYCHKDTTIKKAWDSGLLRLKKRLKCLIEQFFPALKRSALYAQLERSLPCRPSLWCWSLNEPLQRIVQLMQLSALKVLGGMQDIFCFMFFSSSEMEKIKFWVSWEE